MASIDKTYTNSYEEYKEFKDWADKQYLTFFNGYTVRIGNYVWIWNEEDFKDGELPIMNTPIWMDIYLIQHCKSQFVLDRMKSVHSKENYKLFQTIDLSANPPKDYRQNRKVIIKRNNRSLFPIHSKPYNTKMWWLQCKDNFWYHEETGMWVSEEMYYPHNTNTSHMSSIKALIRHLRRQYLPTGIVFTLSGRYVGEEYDVIIK